MTLDFETHRVPRRDGVRRMDHLPWRPEYFEGTFFLIAQAFNVAIWIGRIIIVVTPSS
jgi:hypothetical protein